MDCAPPPPALVAVVHAAADVTRRRVGDIPLPRICLTDTLPAGAGQAVAGTVSFGPTPALGQNPSTWRAHHVVLVLHETLHQVTMSRDSGEGIDMELEEGLCEAVTHDLLPVVIRRIGATMGPAAIAYRNQVTRVRRASAAATTSRWTSRAATAWRAALMATPPAQRIIH